MRIKALIVAAMFVALCGCKGEDAKTPEKAPEKAAEKAAEKAPVKEAAKTPEKATDKQAEKAPEKAPVKEAEAKPEIKPAGTVENKPEVKKTAVKVEAKPEVEKVQAKVETKPEVKKPEAIVSEPNPTGKKIAIEFFVMSQCPFGTQVMNGISPVLRKMGAWLDFRLEYIGQVQGDQLTSMHGDSEVKGNIIELCLQKHLAKDYGFMATVDCMNKEMRSIPGNWEECARQASVSEADLALLKGCYEGDEGKGLLKTSFELAQTKGARGSPTMFVGGKPYRGGRAERDLMRAICAEMPEDARAQACADIPPPIKISGYLLNDKRCSDRSCDTDRLEGSFQSMFPGLALKKLDYADAEGKKLYQEEGIQFLPVMLFDENIQKADGYARLERFLQPSLSGKWKVFKGRAKFDPSAEICDNGADDTGNGKVDCDDDSCKNNLLCRAEVAGKLELFVMSECPFGLKAFTAMKEVIPAFGEELKFEVHFIGDEQDGKLTAMHGQSEVDENIRELCALRKAPKKAMDYIWCRNENIRDQNWIACAEKAGIAAELKSCFEGEEGKKLLSDDYKVAKGLGVGASPTWIANGRHKFSGIDAATIQRNLCQHNTGLAGCAKALSADTGAPAGSCN